LGVVCRAIPEELAAVADSVPGPQREWLIDLLQCLNLIEAQGLRADFHSINPNAIYADDFFRSISQLRRKGKAAVLLAALYGQRDAVRSELASLRVDGKLGIPAGKLSGIALGTVPAGCDASVVRDFGYLAGTTSHLQVAWLGEALVEIHSTQHEIAFLASKTLA